MANKPPLHRVHWFAYHCRLEHFGDFATNHRNEITCGLCKRKLSKQKNWFTLNKPSVILNIGGTQND